MEGGALVVHVIITDARLARSRAIHLGGGQLAAVAAVLSLLIGLAAAGLYHGVQQWLGPDRATSMAGVEEAQERERFMRASIDAMARKLGEMQARMMQLESLGERVMGLAGMPSLDKDRSTTGQGGALVAGRSLSLQELDAALDDLAALTDRRVDLMTVVESRLFEEHIHKHMIPTQAPVLGRSIGSPFGWRIDPLTGQSALHTGLDFPADTGTAILAAAGGVVVAQEYHPAYGNMVEIDHGNQLMTRYAHASRTLVKLGDLVRRGQKIAEVGTSGRSTGPHLHFEVWVQGVPQDPQKFLAAGRNAQDAPVVAARSAKTQVARR